MPDFDRRTFLRGAAATAGAAALGGPFQGFVATAFGASSKPDFRDLGPIPDQRDGAVRLWLPDGFKYRSFHDTEFPVVLDDGTLLPGRHDGMGAFAGPNGNSILIRNHEVNGPGDAVRQPGTAYDPTAQGGTTTIEVTPTGEVVSCLHEPQRHADELLPAAGCRGAPGSRARRRSTAPTSGPDFTGRLQRAADASAHGFIFEVPVDGPASRQPITAAGRFAHEAVAFDPRDGILYLTEDNFGFPSGFYRYIPPTNPMETGSLDNGGSSRCSRSSACRTRTSRPSQPHGATYDVEWVDIADPAPTFPYTPGQTAPTTNDTALTHVGSQGWAQGAAFFSRLEGAAYDNGVVYFSSTQGGGAAETSIGPIADGYGNGSGQVWAYRHPRADAAARVPVAGPDVLDFPDNVTTSPRGTLILCEDNVNDNYLRGLTPRRPALQHRAQPARRARTGAPSVQRRVRGIDVQPGRRDAVREHPGLAGNVVRDLGRRGGGSASEGSSAPRCPRRTAARGCPRGSGERSGRAATTGRRPAPSGHAP